MNEVSHIRVVQHLVNRYRWATLGTGGVDIEDLMQIGRMAAAKAERTWSPDRGAALGSHVYRVVHNDLHKAANEQCSVVRLPHTQLAKRVRRPLIVEGDRDVPRLGQDDHPVTFWDVLTRAPSATDDSDALVRRRVAECLARIPERWAEVLRMRYAEDLTHVEVAAELGVSRQRVQQLETKGLAAFREEWLAETVEECE